MAERPNIKSESQKELDKVEAQFDQFEKQLMALNNMPMGNAEATEQQTKISTREANTSDAPYLKPIRTIGPGVNPKTGEKEGFNEKFRSQYEYAKQYIRVIAENNEIVGETIECWTKPFPGINLEFWRVPSNKPVMIPRYLASQLATRQYIRYSMEEPRMRGTEDGHQFYSGMIGRDVRKRLDCRPVGNVSVSMFS